MKHAIITKKKIKTKNWGGGTTTELFIYPPTADYSKRNFDFRISTATVEIEKSDFTSLPNISRSLMVLDGKMTLHHENHHSKQLNKFDLDSFEGGWKTSSVGTCTDFNLMTTGKTTGEFKAFSIEKNEKLKYLTEGKCDYLLLYVYNGEIEVETDEKKLSLSLGDLLLISETTGNKLLLKASIYSEIIITSVHSNS